MRKFWDSLDKKYLKVCGYASATVLVVLIIIGLMFATGGFWVRLWSIFTAVLKPLVVGFIISYLLSPLVDRIELVLDKQKKHKWARPVAIFLSFFIIIAVVALLLTLLTLTVYRNVTAINFETIIGLFNSVQQDTESFVNTVKEYLSAKGITVDMLGTTIVKALVSIKDIIVGLFFGIIFSIYFMIDGRRIKDYWKRAFAILTSSKDEERLEQFWKDTDRIFSGYLRGQFIDASIVCVLTGFVFVLAGVPEGLLIALMVGIGNLIPYVGPIVGYVSVVLVCLPTQSYRQMLIGIIALFVIMLVDGNIINPRLLSNNIKIHPLLVVAALIGGGALGGFVGMLVAVPVAALIKLYFDRFLDAKEAKDKIQ